MSLEKMMTVTNATRNTPINCALVALYSDSSKDEMLQKVIEKQSV